MAATTSELSQALKIALGEYFGEKRRLVGWERRPFAYRSSFPVEELDVRLEDGTSLPVLFKDISPQALPEEIREAKPAFLYDPLREIDTYRGILAGQQLGTAVCYGAMVDPQAERYWLFLERVMGWRLYQVGEIGVWQEAARWLAVLHSRFVRERGLAARRLLQHDRDSYRLWMRRALEFARQPDARCLAEERQGLEWLAGRYERVVEYLAALPTTFIHGEFYPSNILVAETGDRLRVCPVDWEMAAIGPGLLDLAALTAGAWGREEREGIALAYQENLPGRQRWSGRKDFLAELDFCRLHVAVQWLGWSQQWTPPPEHAYTWLSEALQLAETLRL
jgi:hypothetical protein